MFASRHPALNHAAQFPESSERADGSSLDPERFDGNVGSAIGQVADPAWRIGGPGVEDDIGTKLAGISQLLFDDIDNDRARS